MTIVKRQWKHWGMKKLDDLRLTRLLELEVKLSTNDATGNMTKKELKEHDEIKKEIEDMVWENQILHKRVIRELEDNNGLRESVTKLWQEKEKLLKIVEQSKGELTKISNIYTKH